MKNYYKVTMLLMLICALSACAPKVTTSKVTNTGVSSPIGTTPPPPPPPIDPGGTTIGSCDGVPRDGATRCYYKNIPTIQASGGTYGQTWWSSTNFIASSGNSPGQFSTDATFNVRIIARSPTANATSTFNKTCSSFMMNATKIRVQLMMHKTGVTVGEVATLTANLNTASNVYHYTVPATSDPLVLEVINVESDSRCSGAYGSKPSSCTTNPYLDIPINNNGPTECVAFDIQYSTDETYDLPGSSAL